MYNLTDSVEDEVLSMLVPLCWGDLVDSDPETSVDTDDGIVWPNWEDIQQPWEDPSTWEDNPPWIWSLVEEIPPPYTKVERLQEYHFAPSDLGMGLAPPGYRKRLLSGWIQL